MHLSVSSIIFMCFGVFRFAKMYILCLYAYVHMLCIVCVNFAVKLCCIFGIKFLYVDMRLCIMWILDYSLVHVPRPFTWCSKHLNDMNVHFTYTHTLCTCLGFRLVKFCMLECFLSCAYTMYFFKYCKVLYVRIIF